MILSIVRTAFMNLRRDRGALTLSFVVPIAFFSIFAGIFGARSGGTDPIQVAVVDEDQSGVSQRFVEALKAEGGLKAETGPTGGKGAARSVFDAASAEAAVRAGDYPVAIIISKGFGDAPIGSGTPGKQPKLQILNDGSDPIAAQVVYGLVQRSAMLSMTAAAPGQAAAPGPPGYVSAEVRDVVGENKKNPLVAFYAAGIGVMFLLFSASAAGGAILDESESGTLDRILSSRVTMTTLLLGKLIYAALLGFTQLTVMFLWGALAFQVELFQHLGGFLVMATATALASAGLGLMLASSCKTRAQLGALTTLVVLVMSALGGSMVPRFIMPEFLQKIGLVTFNAWAIDGFSKIFWREEPVTHVWPQVLVLLGAAALFFAVARRLARRWEVA